jgi:hypothetical protein
MTRSNSSSFSTNSSRVGKAMSDSSLIGVPSCFSGGRRMVKWTRSTEASAFSRLRQVRSPGCGSPDTSSTRRRSRMPFGDGDGAVVLRRSAHPAAAPTESSMMFSPPWLISTVHISLSARVAVV